MDADSVEDKTCRICGFVDTRNINIFDSKWKNLLYKIITVFPIIIYESDPLPKNICRKCVTNVSLIFEETQKLFRVQKKWIDNVRHNMPDHPFLRVMGLIEESNKNMIVKAREIEPKFPHKEPRILTKWFIPDEEEREDTNAMFPTTPQPTNALNILKSRILSNEPGRKKEANRSSLDSAVNVTVKKECTAVKKSEPPATSTPKIKTEIVSNIKELQSKLQSNGCTLMSLSPPTSKAVKMPPINRVRSSLKCKFCTKCFPNINFLAKHQVQHLTLSDRRIFDKKFLEKKVRRGRLIPMGDKKCIRCLNCWKLFLDNRGILTHWSGGECEFFCQICGEEFSSNPKLLREHVPKVHGISYKSSRRKNQTEPVSYPNSSSESSSNDAPAFPLDVKIKEEPMEEEDEAGSYNVIPKISLNKSDKTTSKPSMLSKTGKKKKNKISNTKCQICGVEFDNFRSKNSHMRKHKNRTEFQHGPIKQEQNDDDSMDWDGKYPEDISKPRLQVKRLSDLQDPSISSQFSEEELILSSSSLIEEPTSAPAKSSGSEDHMEYGKIYNCHPCGKKFNLKTELFEHKRQCQSNNKFACRFCLRAFITSADLQMHIMLMHRDS